MLIAVSEISLMLPTQVYEYSIITGPCPLPAPSLTPVCNVAYLYCTSKIARLNIHKVQYRIWQEVG